MPPQTDAEILDRATTYPYALPRESFVFVGGAARPLLGDPAGPLDRAVVEGPAARVTALVDLPGFGSAELERCVPVLAYGSNAAPSALARKLARPGVPTDPVVVLRAALHGFDVVFSAHVAAYGAIPATLQAAEGVSAHVFLMLLSEGLLLALEATEPNYRLVRLPGARIEAEWGVEVSSPRAFVSRHGCLDVGGEEAALAAVSASGRRLAAWTGLEALRFAAARVSAHADVEAFVLETVRDPTGPARCTEALRRSARPFRGVREASRAEDPSA